MCLWIIFSVLVYTEMNGICFGHDRYLDFFFFGVLSLCLRKGNHAQSHTAPDRKLCHVHTCECFKEVILSWGLENGIVESVCLFVC